MSDDARDRLDLLVDTDPLRLRDEAYSLLARAEQAEAERDALAAQVAALTGMLERMPDVHMRFHLLQPDGTHTKLPCTDWCYACKLQTAIERAEQAEAEQDRLKAEILRLSERLRLRQEQAEVERDELLAKWEILAERTLVASALLSEAEPDLEAELAPHRSEMLRKVLAGEAGRDDLLPILVPKLAEVERQRAEQAEAVVREQVAAEIETLRQRLLNQPAPQRPRAVDALWEAAKIARGGR